MKAPAACMTTTMNYKTEHIFTAIVVQYVCENVLYSYGYVHSICVYIILYHVILLNIVFYIYKDMYM